MMSKLRVSWFWLVTWHHKSESAVKSVCQKVSVKGQETCADRKTSAIDCYTGTSLYCICFPGWKLNLNGGKLMLLVHMLDMALALDNACRQGADKCLVTQVPQLALCFCVCNTRE